jgi:DNA-binding response OmpR family regulator/predicted regulator of Ras-like GTPase activity (Roadblock/LC7/MglB family)
MPSVLFVDDDVSFLASLMDALAGEPYQARYAQDGLEALGVLRTHTPDLVVTDVSMPRMDGVQLLQEILRLGSHIPCLVMTAFGTPTLLKTVTQCGGIEFIHKPVDIHQLKVRIREMLEARRATSVVHGLALASCLQLLAMEMKSCTVKIVKGDAGGLLFFRQGRLVHAATGDREGPDAFYQILSWDPVELGIHDGCTTPQTTIEQSLDALLLDAFRRSDEESRQTGPARPGRDAREGAVMALEAYLEEFKSIKGYISAGIMDYTGELLASHSASNRVDLASTGAIFNDIFRSAHEASGKIGLDACRNMVISTPKGIVVMECSGADKRPHIHMLAVLEEGGNQALAKVTIAKVLPKIVADLT